MNVKFEYMYRDAGNYKLYGSAIFYNNDQISFNELESRIRNSLIDESYFVPAKCSIPKLEFPEIDEKLDHDWHEFISISLTEDPANIDLDIIEFIQLSTIAHRKAFP